MFLFPRGGLIAFSGPQTFRAKDAPRYTRAVVTVFVAAGLGMVVTVILKLLYVYRNQKTRHARQVELEEAAHQQ